MKKWHTKSGKVIEISEMHDYHLMNAIKMLEKQREEAYQTRIEYFLDLTNPSNLLKQSIKIFKDLTPNIYWDLREEAKARGFNLNKDIVEPSNDNE